jgi:hypothetical protein
LNASVSRRKYKTLFVAVILFLILTAVLNKGRSKLDRLPFGFSALLGLLLGSTGLFFLSRIPVAGNSYFVTHSVAEWVLPIAGVSVYSNAIIWSCLPALVLVLIAYPWKKLVPVAAGFACGFACFLAANIFMPAVDISWIPGRFMDFIWLSINSIICLILVVVASFRLR